MTDPALRADQVLSSHAPTQARTAARSTASAPSTGRIYAALVLGILCIALSAIFVRWSAVPGTVSALYRVAISTVVLAPLFVRGLGRGTIQFSRRLWVLAVVAGLFFALDLALWNTSLFMTSATNATLLGNDAPIFVGLGALLLFRERLRPAYWVGLALALVGMGSIVGADVLRHPHLGLGDLLAFAAGISYAGYLLATQRVRVGLDTLSSLWLAGAAGTVVLLALNLALGRPLWGFPPSSLLALLGLGLVSQVTGWLAINYALGHLPASIVSVTLLGQPVLTALLAIPLLGEALLSHQIVGGIITLAGIVLVNRGVARRAKDAADVAAKGVANGAA